MAEVKKTYLDLEGLTLYDEKIKGVIGTQTAAAESKAKGYTDTEIDKVEASIKSINEAATGLSGRVNTLETTATSHGTKITNLETTVNTDHEGRLDKLEGAATQEGSVAHSVKTAVDNINATIGEVPEGKTVMGTITDGDKAINDKIGTVPADKTVVQMISEAQTAATYDDTKVKADIAANAKAISDEVTRAKAAEKANADNIVTLNTNLGTLDTYVGDFPADSGATSVVDYVDKKTATNATAIGNNATAIEGEITRAKAAEKAISDLVGVLPEGTTATTVVGYVDEKASAADTKVGDLTTLTTDAKGTVVAAINEVDKNTDNLKAYVGTFEPIEGVETVVAYINNKVASAGHLKRAIVDALPAVGEADVDTIYMIKDTSVAGADKYTEYMLIDGEFQVIGDTTVDLSNYATKKYAEDEADAAESAAKTYADGLNTAMDTRVDALEAAIGEGGGVAQQISAAIGALDANITSAAPEAGKGVQVQVVEVDGKITNVNVTGDFSEAYDAKGAASTAETNAKNYADSLNAKIGSIADADIDALFADTPAEPEA